MVLRLFDAGDEAYALIRSVTRPCMGVPFRAFTWAELLEAPCTEPSCPEHALQNQAQDAARMIERALKSMEGGGSMEDGESLEDAVARLELQGELSQVETQSGERMLKMATSVFQEVLALPTRAERLEEKEFFKDVWYKYEHVTARNAVSSHVVVMPYGSTAPPGLEDASVIPLTVPLTLVYGNRA